MRGLDRITSKTHSLFLRSIIQIFFFFGGTKGPNQDHSLEITRSHLLAHKNCLMSNSWSKWKRLSGKGVSSWSLKVIKQGEMGLFAEML